VYTEAERQNTKQKNKTIFILERKKTMNEERVMEIMKAVQNYSDSDALAAMTPEQAVEALNAKGGNFTLEEITILGEAMNLVAKGELDESALEDVAGGVSRTTVWGVCSILQTACVIGGTYCAIAAVCW